MILQALPPESVQDAVPTIEPFLRQMEKRYPDDWPAEEQLKQAVDGRLTLWVVWEPEEKKAYGLVGTKITETPTGKRVCQIETTAGYHHQKWVSLIGLIERYGRENGCSSIEIRGRSGWARSLPDYDLRRETVLAKELGE